MKQVDDQVKNNFPFCYKNSVDSNPKKITYESTFLLISINIKIPTLQEFSDLIRMAAGGNWNRSYNIG